MLQGFPKENEVQSSPAGNSSCVSRRMQHTDSTLCLYGKQLGSRFRASLIRLLLLFIFTLVTVWGKNLEVMVRTEQLLVVRDILTHCCPHLQLSERSLQGMEGSAAEVHWLQAWWRRRALGRGRTAGQTGGQATGLHFFSRLCERGM